MVATTFIDLLTKFQVSTYAGVEDFADKFQFLFTVIVLLLCSAVITAKQYLLSPISCYLSSDAGGLNLHAYVENYCWVQGTVPMTPSSQLPSTEAEWTQMDKMKIFYYQWVPFVLGLQCVCFYLPKMLWQMFCYNKTGTDLQHIVTSANQALHSNEEARTKMISIIAKNIEQVLVQERDRDSGRWALLTCCMRRFGPQLVPAYLIFKVAYLLNGITQLLMMCRLLGFKDFNMLSFGQAVVGNILNGSDWSTTLNFPRVGFCWVSMAHTGSKAMVTAQCVLPVNMLNERIFYCWILCGSLLMGSSILVWIVRLTTVKRRTDFIRKLLILSEEITIEKRDKVLVTRFEKKFLRKDGVFLLNVIKINVGDVIAGEVMCQLWRAFLGSYLNEDLRGAISDSEDVPNATMVRLRSHAIPTVSAITPTAQVPDPQSQF